MKTHDSESQVLFTIMHSTTINMPSYYMPTSYPTRQLHSYIATYQYIIQFISITSYQQSFFPKSIKQWNSLPMITSASALSLMFNYII